MQVAVAHEGPRSKRFWGATGYLAVDPCSSGVRGASRASRVSAIWAVTATSTKASLPAKDSPPPGPPSAPNTHVPVIVKSKTNFNFFSNFTTIFNSSFNQIESFKFFKSHVLLFFQNSSRK